MTFTEYGLDEEVLKILIQFVGGTTSEIQVIQLVYMWLMGFPFDALWLKTHLSCLK